MNRIISVIFIWLACSLQLFGASVTLTWNANPEPDLQGYIFHWGTEANPDINGNHVNVDNVTIYTVDNLIEGQTYYFTVSAINTSGLVSLPSDQVIYTIPIPPAPTFNLTVNGGTGSGNYPVGTTISITAKIPKGYKFKYWTGDIQILNNFLNASTTAIIPSMNVTITAEFEKKGQR